MKCPNCEELLIMSERQGIEIDYCPKCRGVWLDRGELDKIIERSASAESHDGDSTFTNNEKHRDDREWSNDHYKKDNKHYHKRRGNFLSDLFD
jgi:Zn-finger nucleic acid-binding protein